ncbi:MAG: BolA family transcriptional regulator [Alphaproteobacteria bacterium]|nr:BolA family transcriptional regulator [Alphaproteobacteria bacterium]
MTLKNQIETKLDRLFSPSYLKVEDNTSKHVGHENYKPGGESHFRVVLVSAKFTNTTRIQRHQMVYACLSEELKKCIHALELKALSPEEVVESNELV